jgi:2',3'-cyclic-nucleotide 2'-phosphodiesterase (5'-nucleotidase family)
MREHVKRYLLILVVAGVLATVLSSCGEEKEEGSSRPVDVIVLFSSDLLGRIRSCGCAVEDMGGLGRMVTYIERTRNRFSNLLVLDAGDAFNLDLSYSKPEADLTWDAFGLMRLDAFAPGEIDFIFGLSYLEELAERNGIDILAANVVDPNTGEPIFGLPYKVVEFEGRLRIAVTGVLDDTIRFPGYIDTEPFDVIPVREALERIVPRMKQEADFLILLSHLGQDRSLELAGELPAFDLVIVGHGQPVIKKTKKVGETMVVATGSGKYMGRVELTLSEAGEHQSGTYTLVPLREDIAIHEDVRALFEFYGLTLTDKEEKKRKH